jgi:hypothetical protein
VRSHVAAPVTGPVVSAPLSPGELPVAGFAALPPGDVPDGGGVVVPHPPHRGMVPGAQIMRAGAPAGPGAAVRATGAGPGTGAGSGTGLVAVFRPGHGRPATPVTARVRTARPGTTGPGWQSGGTPGTRHATAADGTAGTPRSRWAAAVTARPLETPQPLPTAFHALARAVTGQPRPPRYTTGSATRSALAAAGALGATTGTVVHLPRSPATPADAAVLAHELAHTRNPVRRPRFLLSGASALLDDDERQALSAGRGPGGGSTGRSDSEPVGAGIVGRLPVGGGMGAVTDVAVRAAKAAVIEAGAGPLSALSAGMAGPAPGMAGHGPEATAAGWASGPAGAPPPGSAVPGGPAGTAPDATTVQQAGAGGAAAGGGTAAGLDPDRVMEIIEERLLREIERRGGRWAGVF